LLLPIASTGMFCGKNWHANIDRQVSRMVATEGAGIPSYCRSKMIGREKDRAARRKRLRASELRLQRLRELIERRARAGLDASDGWRLFEVGTSSLAAMRQTEMLLDALDLAHENQWSGAAALLRDVASANRVRFPPGTPIATSQSESPDCHLLESGVASLCLGSPHGVEVGIVGPGEIVGLWDLLTSERWPINVVATTNCETIPISRAKVVDRLESDANGLRYLHADVARHWGEAMMIARCNAEHSVRERVARWILTVAGHFDGPVGPISHDRIAALLGVRRASVTLALHQLEGEGAITSMRNHIDVRAKSGLEQLACDCHVYLSGEPTIPRRPQILATSPLVDGSS
jgi:CRP-like cAMP-binding protein